MLMRQFARAGLGAGLLLAAGTAHADTPRPPAIPPETLAFEKSLHKQTGDIALPQAKAVLHLGDQYYFLGPDEARKVITQIWGNPPGSADDVLGIVIAKGATSYDNLWAAVVTYQPTGHVSDADAKTEDYDAVLTQMREGEGEENAERRKQGFPAIHLVGWAQPPSYDPARHALIWARDIAFVGQKIDTLNYDVRVLGREGVLSLNMVSDMRALAPVRAAAAEFGKVAAFDQGRGYADFNAATDKAAGYGLAGLIAGGVGLAVVKKLGLLGLILAFGKKFIIIIGVALVGAGRYAMRLFGRRGASEG